MFFGPNLDGRAESGRSPRENYCKSICFHCPVRVECLAVALKNEEPWGVWGGMGEGERRRFRRFLIKNGFRKHIPQERSVLRTMMAKFYED